MSPFFLVPESLEMIIPSGVMEDWTLLMPAFSPLFLRKVRTVKEMPAGSTIKRIEERAYFMQDEEWVKDRKPRLIEDAHPHYHYVYGMGGRALDVSETYGVSIAYNDLSDPEAGLHLRYIYTGDEVESPE